MTNALRARPPVRAASASQPRPRLRAGPTGSFVELRPACPQDLESVREFLDQLAPATAFARFFSGLGTASTALARSLVEPAPGRGAWLATLHPGDRAAAARPADDLAADDLAGDAGRGGAVVGHASWAQTGTEAEISVVVTGACQGMGLGSALIDVVLAQVLGGTADQLRLDVLASNRVVTSMIARRWPGVLPERDGTQLTYRIRLNPPAAPRLR